MITCNNKLSITLRSKTTPQHLQPPQHQKFPQCRQPLQQLQTPQHRQTPQHLQPPQHQKPPQHRQTPQHLQPPQHRQTPRFLKNSKTQNAYSLSLHLFLLIIGTLGICTLGLAPGCGDNGSKSPGDDAATHDGAIDADHSDRDDLDPDAHNGEVFCDDDPDSPVGTRRDCESECDYGTQVCLSNGEWSECTAVTDCDCTNPGETRIIPCGNCGEASQECGTDLKWSYPGQCFNEGECSPGSVDTEPCEHGGERTRLCSNECEWGEWDTSTCGECAPGTVEATNEGCDELWEIKRLECNSEGFWEVTIPCTADCHFPAREGTEGDFKDEICIPGGPFIMGADEDENIHPDPHEGPKHTVILTPYLIDKYQVTNGRYKECVDAGVCPEPDSWEPDLEDYPFRASSFDVYDWPTVLSFVDTFCEWDEGRTTPTEAQWEKAARGPAPREVLYPWGDDEATCYMVTASDCLNQSGIQPVDAFPDGVSYYGLYNMATNLGEICSDYYGEDYYSYSPLVDPTGPEEGELRVWRGLSFRENMYFYRQFVPLVTLRCTASSVALGFRCARRGY